MPREQATVQTSPTIRRRSDGFDLSPFLSPAVLWTPGYVDEASAWLEHVPFAFWVVEALQPDCIVELGTHTGVSYLAFCEAVQRLQLPTRCYAVDTWQGDEHTGFYGDDVLQRLSEVHDPRYRHFSRLIRSTFDDAQRYFEDGSIDLLHIDGLHTYEAVEHDFRTWEPKLSAKAVVLFHDTNVREREFGVFRLWGELAAAYPHFQFIHGHGLGVLAVGASVPPALTTLLEAGLQPQATRAVRELFARFGERVSLLPRLHRQAADQQRLTAELADRGGRLADAERALAEHRELQNATATQAAEAELLKEEVRGREMRLAELEAAAAARQAEAERLSKALAGREAELAETERSAATQADRLDAVAERLGAEEARARQLAGERAVRDARLAELGAALAAEQGRAHRLDGEVARLAAELKSTRKSASWRLTRPFRTIGPVIGGVVLGSGRLARRLLRLAARPLRRPLRTLALKRKPLRRLAWLLGRSDRQAVRAVWTLRASPLFDRKWYLNQYRDVGKAGKDPVLHYVRSGAKKGYNPSPGFDGAAYLVLNPDVRAAGLNPLAHYVEYGKAEGRRIAAAAGAGGTALVPSPRTSSDDGPLAVPDVLQHRFPALQPLRVYFVPGTARRLTMVTDSINKGSLYGGVGTAIIFSALLAKAMGAGLRLVTRTQRPVETNFGNVMKVHGIDWSENVQFLYADDADPKTVIDVGDEDLFLTTSWWTTWCTKQAVGSRRIVYLLQEDERMFYPAGDDFLRCAEVIADPDMRFVINSEMLFEHFLAEGFENIRAHGLWFEPSFPPSQYYLEPRKKDARKNFFFYARPGINVRNLYYRGLEAINGALEQGTLKPEEWDFHFVGRDLADITLAKGVRPRMLENLAWADYAALVRTIDVGMSLMFTPHPSYPPLDLAASGAVVVTNTYGRKTSLDRYSKNIVCADTAVPALVEGIARAVALAEDWPTRMQNYKENRMLRDWRQSFGPVIEMLTRG